LNVKLGFAIYVKNCWKWWNNNYCCSLSTWTLAWVFCWYIL